MDKIVCLGKNYPEHAKEMGEALPEKPVIFLKPPSVLVLVEERAKLCLPKGAGEIHHETEVVLKIAKDGRSIEAMTIGLDMTLRNRQMEQKKKGHPWTTSKVFENSAVIGPWISGKKLESAKKLPFVLEVDGVVRQKGEMQEMTLSPEKAVAYVAEFFPLCEGDLIFTGTPKGVGAVSPGQSGKLSWGELTYWVDWV